MIRSIILFATLAVIGTTVPAVARDDGVAPERPAFAFPRWREDWSDFMPADDADWADAIRHVDLSADGSVWASFGGHARARFESFSDFGFGGAPDPSRSYLLTRLMLHADVHFGENVRVFVEGKSAATTEDAANMPGGRVGLNVDSIALEQAFVDIVVPFDDTTLTVRPGRQALQFGSQRLVSPLPWANTQRRWDGVSAIVESGDWTVHGFWTQFVPTRKYEFNESESSDEFSGVFATGPLGGTDLGLDLYYFYRDNETASFNGTGGGEDRSTVGGRVKGAIADTAFDFDLEGAYQFGSIGSGDIDAFFVASELGVTFADAAWKPRLHIGFDYASGDDQVGGDVETFSQLYPLGHKYHGYIDTIGRQNIMDLSGGVSFTPVKGWRAAVAAHAFWRAEELDDLYNAGGAAIRQGAAGTSKEVGIELDVTVRHKFDRHLAMLLGYSHFFAGDFIEETGADDDIDFVYAQLQYTF